MSFDSLLINTCDLIDKTTVAWSEETETLRAGIVCRIQYGNKWIRSYKGESVLSTALIFFQPTLVIGFQTRVVFDGREHAILNISKPQDSVAIHHLEVYVE
jgi:uncharacterized protein YdeI (YjbR/CyaY-like superfamily)